MNIGVLLILLFLLPAARAHVVPVPRIERANLEKLSFIADLSALSRQIFPEEKRAIAPFGGVKLTPFLELDLTELVIVTNSYPGTEEEIQEQFTRGQDRLTQVLRQALRSGSMSTSDVISVTTGAQILSRLKLEFGVDKVEMSYWAEENTKAHVSSFSDRPLTGTSPALLTMFEFIYRGRKARLAFISSFINADADPAPGFPAIFRSVVPETGFDWVYLSADGLGHFSANRNNGLSIANDQLLASLKADGAVLLDYPTDPTYSRPQVIGEMSFMQGRLPLEELGLERIWTYPIHTPGIFGYCLKPGDEVRAYSKSGAPNILPGPELKQIGETVTWELK